MKREESSDLSENKKKKEKKIDSVDLVSKSVGGELVVEVREIGDPPGVSLSRFSLWEIGRAHV